MGENDERISLLERLIAARRRPPRDTTSTTAKAGTRTTSAAATAHESVFNTQRRQLPLPQLAAGLFAVQHLDARPGLGDAAASPSSSNAPTRSDAI